MSRAVRFGLMLLAIVSLPAHPSTAGPPASAGHGSTPYINVGVPDGSGGMLVACTVYRGAHFSELYVQHVNSAGALLWTNADAPLSLSTDDNHAPAIVSDGAGGAIVAWVDFRSGPSVYAQRVNSAGVTLWTTGGISITTSAGTWDNSLRMIADSFGGAILAWQDSRSNGDIYAQHITGSGALVWTSGGVPVCSTPEMQVEPALIADGAGGALIAWRDLRSAGTSGADIYAQRLDSSGDVLWTPNGVLVCSASGDQQSPALVLSAAGSPIVVWRDPRGIFAQLLSTAGAAQWTVDGVALCTAAGTKYEPYVVSDGSSGALVSWWDDRGSTRGLFAGRVTSTGARPWTVDGVAIRTDINLDTRNTQAIMPDGSGGAVLAWKEWPNGPAVIRAQRVNGSGVSQWGATGVSWPPYDFYGDPGQLAICSDGAGGSLVSWREWGIGEPETYAIRLSGAGAPLWGGPVCIRADAGRERMPAVISDGVGGTITVWEELEAGGFDLYAKRVNHLGTTLWTRVPVCTAAGDQFYPALASDGAGGAIVVWADARDGADIFVAAQRLSSGGVPQWTANGATVSAVPGWGYNAGVVADGLGGAVIAWEQVDATGHNRVFAQRLSGSGVPQWAAGGLALATPVGEGNQRITGESEPTPNGFLVSDGAGGAIVAWEFERFGADFDIYSQRVSASGEMLWGPTGRALCTASGDQMEPRVTVDGSGGMIAVWSDARFGSYVLAAQRIDGSGTCLWEPNDVPVTMFSTGYSYRPAITGDGLGGAIVAWDDGRSSGPHVYAQHIAAWDGSQLWGSSDVQICAASSTQDRARLAADGAGGAVIAWTDYRGGSSNDFADIYAQRLSAAGVPQWPSGGVLVCGQSHSQLGDGILSDGTGGTVITWTDRRDGVLDRTFAQRLSGAGALTWPTGGLSDVPSAPPSTVALGLAGARPNPASGAPNIVFTLPSDQPASLELLDVTGRRLVQRSVGSFGAGLHEVRLAPAEPLAPGIYLVRLLQGRQAITRRVCIVGQ